MRSFSEYQPEINDSSTYGFSLGKSITTNPISWIISIIVLVVFVLVGFFYPVHLKTVAVRQLGDVTQSINQQNQTLQNNINKTVEKLQGFGMKPNQAKEYMQSAQRMHDSIKTASADDVLKTYEELKKTNIPQAKLYPDSFTVLQNAASAYQKRKSDTLKELQAVNSQFDSVFTLWAKAQAIADKNQGVAGAQEQVNRYSINKMPFIRGYDVNLPDLDPKSEAFASDVFYEDYPNKEPAERKKGAGLRDLMGLLGN